MKKSADPKSIFMEIAEAQDQFYAEKNGTKINQTALRVEQGEYIITEKKQSIGIAANSTEIGTYNLQQCVSIYLKDKTKHGLAHIDGHTEISYLNEFCKNFDGENLTITIFGARSLAGFGLNDPEYNLDRVTDFLKFAYPDLKIDDLVKARDKNLQDFTIDENGIVHDKTLAGGVSDKPNSWENRALHSIHELRRKNRWQGTYPLIKGNDHTDTPIYLDETVLVKLENFGNNPSHNPEENNTFNPVSHEFDKAVTIIAEKWNSEVERLSNLKNKNEALREADITSLIKKTPLNIGLGAEHSELNIRIAEAIMRSQNIESLNNDLLEITSDTHQFSTIADALEVLMEHDQQINKQAFLKEIADNYNGRNNSNLTKDQVASKQYGGEITIRDFMLCVSHHSKKLGYLSIIYSQGGYYNDRDLQPQPYTIADAKEALSLLRFEGMIDQICEAHNLQLKEEITALQNVIIDSSNLRKAVDTEYGQHQNYNKICAAINRLGNDTVNLNDLPNFGILQKYIPENFKEAIQNHINTNMIPEKQHRFINDESGYNLIQSDVLSILDESYPKFNEFTISRGLASKKRKDNTLDTQHLTVQTSNEHQSQKYVNNEEINLYVNQDETSNSKNLTKTEKTFLSSPKKKFNLVSSLEGTNGKSLTEIQNIISNGKRKNLQEETNVQLANKSSSTKIGTVSIIVESDHTRDHKENVHALINQIKSNIIKPDTVIFLERKEGCKNLGMKDVILLADIIKYNNKVDEFSKIKMPDMITKTMIYKDALLYNVARDYAIDIKGIEGSKLQSNKKIDEQAYNEEREEYMAKQIIQIADAKKDVILLVGKDHVKSLEHKLNPHLEVQVKENYAAFTKIIKQLKQTTHHIAATKQNNLGALSPSKTPVLKRASNNNIGRS